MLHVAVVCSSRVADPRVHLTRALESVSTRGIGTRGKRDRIEESSTMKQRKTVRLWPDAKRKAGDDACSSVAERGEDASRREKGS